MHTICKSTLAALLLSATPAFAGPFLGAALDRTSSEYSDVKDGTGYSVLGGYQTSSTSFPLFVEASYYDSGKLKLKDSGGLGFSYSGPQLFVGGALKLGESSFLWLKGGYYSFDGKTSYQGDSVSDSLSGLSLGVGFDWMFSKQLGLRLGIETPMKVDNAPGLTEEEVAALGGTKKEKQLSVIQFGLVWRPVFGAQ
ncbi:MAG: outer membrane beta-barrel protein [Stagnimonas sp.]|nr:outer membrane beta-barrel protein [Stagnimonas sp.]